MEPLIEMPFDRWPVIRDSFKRNWPHGVPGYYAMDIQIQHPALGTSYNVKVFCPYGVIDDGVVMFNDKGGSQSEVIVLINNENTINLEEALTKTKRIDWGKLKCVPWTESDVVDLMQRVRDKLGLRIVGEIPTLKHFLSKETEPFILELPPNTYVGSLEIKHIAQVNAVWPHRYETSPRFFQVLIENNLSYGLFSESDKSLLAWVVVCEVGFLAHLCCEEAHRRKGYAEAITKYAINTELKNGRDVFCYIVDTNTNSLNLFKKMNFEIIGVGVRTFLKKDNDS